LNLKDYHLDDLLYAAIRSEKESQRVYSAQARKSKNVFLRYKFSFLAREEEAHEVILERLFRKLFPDRELQIPESSPIPLPDFQDMDPDIEIPDMLERAMDVELAAHDYYLSLRGITGSESDVGLLLEYLASMELGHYRLLEIERNNQVINEEFEEYWKV